MTSDHVRENIIVSHEPAAQFLARHVNRARAEWLASRKSNAPLPEPDAKTAAAVAVIWLRYFWRPVIIT